MLELTLVKSSGPGDRDRAYLGPPGLGRRVAVHVVHDLPHLVVESRLGLGDGLWGELAAGNHSETAAAATARRPARAKAGRIVSGQAAGVATSEWLSEGHRRAKSLTNAVANPLRDGPDTAGGVRERAARCGDPGALLILDAVEDRVLEAMIDEVGALLTRWRRVEPGGVWHLQWPLAP